jgi:alpha/beta superfamily hydrolase
VRDLDLDINPAAEAKATAVLLHPHPDYGGNRWHPFIDGLFRRLPNVGTEAVRFDFSTSDGPGARGEAVAAIARSSATGLPVVLVGYSFGAGIAAGIDEASIVGWYLLAPPAAMLTDAAIGHDSRPKRIVLPERDQFSAPEVVATEVANWPATSVEIVPGADHFLGSHVEPIVEGAIGWIASLLALNDGPGTGSCVTM